MGKPVDILILSNGPGELATWVKPVVRELRRQLGDDREQVRISLVLAPCTNASGQEVAIAQRYSEIDRIQGAADFFPFLLGGKTSENWDWRDQGAVIFLGGDQFFPIVVGKRLGYAIIIYAEWEARWHRWGDRFGVMKPEILKTVAPKHLHKFAVVGDLMAEAGSQKSEVRLPRASADGSQESEGVETVGAGLLEQTVGQLKGRVNLPSEQTPLVGLLPGSKPMKLTLGVPLTLAIAEQVQLQRPEVQFVIPVAPTLDLPTLATYANPDHNPMIQKFGWGSGELVMPEDGQSLPYLMTRSGVKVSLWTQFPAYEMLAQCCICLTTLGANTAELGALTVPMLVLLPTQQLDVMRAWDGIPGLLVNLPGVGAAFATIINGWAARKPSRRAWPNIWAQREIVPELLGRLEPDEIASRVLNYLENPELLEHMRQELRQVRGEPGAAKKLVQLVQDELTNRST